MAEQAVCQGARPFLAPLRVRLLQGGSWVSRPLCTLRSIGQAELALLLTRDKQEIQAPSPSPRPRDSCLRLAMDCPEAPGPVPERRL